MHDVLQQSEIGEVSVPTVVSGSGADEASQETPASQRSSFWNDDLLVWEGPVRSADSGGGGARGAHVVEGGSERGSHSHTITSRSASTHFSQSQSSVVRRYARALAHSHLLG